jgi:cysteine dioxygenase
MSDTSLLTLFNKINDYLQTQQDLSQAGELLKSYNGDDWKTYVHFDESRYHRVRLPFLVNEKFEIMLICWKKGQKSPIHDHPAHGCYLKVLEGCLTETIYPKDCDTQDLLELPSSDILPGNISYMTNEKGYHRISSQSYDTVSLHIYSPPYYVCKTVLTSL